jgi:hypothetical protein
MDFPQTVSKSRKPQRGTTSSKNTPLHIRLDGVSVPPAVRNRVRAMASRKLGKFGKQIERATIRFRDVNGPKGGCDTECRIKLVVSGLPSLVVGQKDSDALTAFSQCIKSAGVALTRALKKAKRSQPKKQRRPVKDDSPIATREELYPRPEDGSLICRRVGRARSNLLAAADRPEKRRRDVPVDTAMPGRSATDRRAGAASTARRNSKLNMAGMVATLEDSMKDRPSRKSTRRSANRGKQDDALRLRASLRASSRKERR